MGEQNCMKITLQRLEGTSRIRRNVDFEHYLTTQIVAPEFHFLSRRHKAFTRRKSVPVRKNASHRSRSSARQLLHASSFASPKNIQIIHEF